MLESPSMHSSHQQKVLSKQLLIQKKTRRPTSKSSPCPSLGCQGTSSDNYPCLDFCKVFYSLFSFLFVLFSLHKWKNALGKVAHIWIPQVHKEVSPNSQQPQALPPRDTLIPRAFLFISCFSPRQKYWVLVSLSDFTVGRKRAAL